ncbi:MAG TPA: hypothetical protein PKW23_01745 [Dictyoglomaceae bacterium]|nr:hypothetical protein [Dictyoglomaceae bacterium]HOL39064.1 hypothetical protein [Dictyoglomaceae bacterium]HOP94403.1 hypothetical protein [Dictyoglomaceae bacterium]HPP15760.1 hypothetical protein [Dictyoglomaceae bacterium]HPU42749.1 hypothetical protein [Dictyoglomaceae bacterium]
MIFDLICALTILGLALKGLKEVFSNKLALIFSVIIAIFLSAYLLPLYMEYIKIPSHIPANLAGFIITFIFSYLLMTLPSFLLRVIIGGGILIILYGVLINYLPPAYRTQILNNSVVFSFIKPVVFGILNILKFIL